ncbi:MAG: beta-lactamase family protein [Chloroflexi bacterium]|nr:beta-lactamase family protein [Chloroflexota bacterium]
MQKQLDRLLTSGLGRVYTAAAVHIRHRGETIYERVVGHPNPEASPTPARIDTLFDLASLTKLFTTTAFLTLVDEGIISLTTPVADVLPEFQGLRPIRPYEHPLNPGEWVTVDPDGEVDAGTITFHHLLTHTSGLPPWHPLYRLPTDRIRPTVLHTFFSYQPGTHVLYSDVGLILLGWAVEALTGLPLDRAIQERVADPLGLTTLAYRPVGRTRFQPNIAATEVCAFRGRRMWGEVHDENAWALGGIAGHAGLFATVRDVAAFGQAWLDRLGDRGTLPISGHLARQAVREQARENEVRRGWGWALRAPVPEGFTYPLGEQAFGHTGFTGTSLYIDPEREVVIAALTNRVYFGRDPQGITAWRRALHEEVSKGL